MRPLTSLNAATLAHQVRCGDISAVAVAEAFLQRIALHESQVHAFASFDAGKVADGAAVASPGALAGVPIGVKDNFDSADWPTEFYSPIYRGNQPSRDSHVVARLRQAGAVIMGKTHTTEFAYMHTGPTCNPHDPQRTPGSSSAGSAAGMAAGFFALALGTQTAGSLIKPAAYCGLHAFKPSYGLVSMEGIKPLAPSFDTVGWYGRSVADLALLAGVLIPGLPAAQPLTGHYAFCRQPDSAELHPEVAEALDSAVRALREAGVRISEVQLPSAFDGVCADHLLINDCEGARSFSVEAQAHPEHLSPSFQAMLDRARATTWAEESAAKARLAELAPRLAQLMAPYDAWLGYSCGIVAPLGLEATGPSDFIKQWMAFGLPQVNLPLPRGSDQLPVGLQMIGKWRDDVQLLAAAQVIADKLGACHKPCTALQEAV